MLSVETMRFNRKNHVIIDATSRSSTWSKELSPFVLGPVETPYGTCLNIENLWQFSKVYIDQVDENQEPLTEWHEWRSKGFKDSFAHRYPKGKGNVPLFSFWRNQKLGYVEARKTIYEPFYRKTVQRTEAWKKLCKTYCEAVEAGMPMVLKDFDSYNHLELHMTYEDVICNENKKFGHSFILYKMLLEEYNEDEPVVSLF